MVLRLAVVASVAAMFAAGAPVALASGGGISSWTLPENISTYGEHIDHIFNVILWLTLITFLIVQVLLIYAIVAFRNKRGEKSSHTHGNHLLELGWTLVPGVILFFLALYQIKTWKDVKITMPDDPNALHVRVMAKQFEWNFQYPGADGLWDTSDDVYTIGKLFVPAHRNVIIDMRSKDVIHSLFLPHARFKQDVVPGMTVRGWFQLTKTTEEARKRRNDPDFEYEIACAELCGVSHHNMRAVVVIHNEDEFGAWYAKESKDAAESLEKYGESTRPAIWDEWEKSNGLVETAAAHHPAGE